MLLRDVNWADRLGDLRLVLPHIDAAGAEWCAPGSLGQVKLLSESAA